MRRLILCMSLIFSTVAPVLADDYELNIEVDVNALAGMNRVDAICNGFGQNDLRLVVIEGDSLPERSILGNLKLDKALVCSRNDSDFREVNLNSTPSRTPTSGYVAIQFKVRKNFSVPKKNISIGVYLVEADLIWDDELELLQLSLNQDEDFVLYREGFTFRRDTVVQEIRQNTANRIEVKDRMNGAGETVEVLQESGKGETINKIISNASTYQAVPVSVYIRRLKPAVNNDAVNSGTLPVK